MSRESQRTYADFDTAVPPKQQTLIPPHPQVATALANREIEPSPLTEQQPEMAMLRLAVEKGAAIETIERLVALQEKMLARQAEIEFNEALNRVQSKIAQVAPDLENSQTHSKYASYAAIDRVIRPIYSAEGFSLSFTEEDCSKPEHICIICLVSKGAHTRRYRKDMPSDGKGPQGGAVMSKPHAAAAADSYAKRYLVKDIFNVAIGADDDDGNLMPENQERDFLSNIQAASNRDELKRAYTDAIKAAVGNQDYNACKLFKEASDKREKELRGA